MSTSTASVITTRRQRAAERRTTALPSVYSDDSVVGFPASPRRARRPAVAMRPPPLNAHPFQPQQSKAPPPPNEIMSECSVAVTNSRPSVVLQQSAVNPPRRPRLFPVGATTTGGGGGSVRSSVTVAPPYSRTGRAAATGGMQLQQQSASNDATRKYSSLTPGQRREVTREFIDKFLVLQRRFPSWNVALPGDGSSLEYIHDIYESYVRQIKMHWSSMQFKIFMVLLFIGIELAASRAGIDLEDYAATQIKTMSRYEGDMLALGQKYSGPGEPGTEWPVEFRVAFVAIVQAGIFFVAKYAERWTKQPGMAKTVHQTIDGFVDSLTSGGSGGGADAAEEELDAHGCSVPPAASSSSFGGGFDMASILGNMMAPGGGGADIGSMVGTAMKFLAPKKPPQPHVAAASPAATNRATSPPRRKAPVFSPKAPQQQQQNESSVV